jgi:surface protein
MIFINGLRFRVGNEFVNGAKVSLPPYTIRLKCREGGETPAFFKGTATQVSQYPNIWDLTYVNNDWSDLLHVAYAENILEILDANSSNVINLNKFAYGCQNLTSVALFDTSTVTDMAMMFYDCENLKSIPLFDTSKVTDMNNMFNLCHSLTNVPLFDTSEVTDLSDMFSDCTSLTSIPLFDTSKVTYMNGMCFHCYKVNSGALALYQQASTQTNPPTNHIQTFRECGSQTQTGSVELSQIPKDWK